MQDQVTSDNMPKTLFEAIINELPLKVQVPPRELVEFRGIDKKKWSIEAREKEEKKFYSQVFIQEYLDNKWKVELHNRDCFLNLKDLLKTEKESQKVTAIRNRMKQFQQAIVNTEKPFHALQLDRETLFFDERQS